jgi:hypothetical protein
MLELIVPTERHLRKKSGEQSPTYCPPAGDCQTALDFAMAGWLLPNCQWPENEMRSLTSNASKGPGSEQETAKYVGIGFWSAAAVLTLIDAE